METAEERIAREKRELNDRMHFKVEMIDLHTKEIRFLDWDYPKTYVADSLTFYWSEHNFSCDCNRGPLFYGSDINDECGVDRFRVLSIKDLTGKLYYAENPAVTEDIELLFYIAEE